MMEFSFTNNCFNRMLETARQKRYNMYAVEPYGFCVGSYDTWTSSKGVAIPWRCRIFRFSSIIIPRIMKIARIIFQTTNRSIRTPIDFSTLPID